MTAFLSFIVLMCIGYFIGGLNERRHFHRLASQEDRLSHIALSNLKNLPPQTYTDAKLVSGNVVIAVDYFKNFIAYIQRIFGGRLRTYESLMIRARREAIIRMKQDAEAMGATMIYNVRFEFSAIGQQPESSAGVELLAYGTAVKGSHA